MIKKLLLFTLLAGSLTGCSKKLSTIKDQQPQMSAKEMAFTPDPRAYSHNDYLQKDSTIALKNGCSGLEADVYLRKDKKLKENKKNQSKLCVAHMSTGIREKRTLESLYLDPLFAKYKQHNGHIYPNSSQNILLMVDVKSGGKKAILVLEKKLEKYSPMISKFDNDGILEESAVTVVVSGYMPPEDFIKSQSLRYMAYDGREKDIYKNENKHYLQTISMNWNKCFSWCGKGQMPENQREKLNAMTKAVHENGQQIRFWATPEKEPVWQELLKANVDLINTDKPAKLHTFLLKNDTQKYVHPRLDKKIQLAIVY